MNVVDLPALPRSGTTKFMIVLGFFALVFAVFGQTLTHNFVAWDDNLLITGNPDAYGLSVRNISQAFSTYDPELYVPLTILSYQFDYTFAGLNPTMFHLTNLILHACNALLVSWFLFLLSKRGRLAIVAGLIFAIHPLNVEAIAWASARKDLLATLFFLASIIGYRYFESSDDKRLYLLSIALFALALLSKVIAVTLPVILVLLYFWDRRKLDRTAIIQLVPFFVLSIVFGVVALFGKQEIVAETNLVQKILMSGRSTIFYFEKFVAPVQLSVIVPYNHPIGFASWDLLISCVIVLLLFIATIFSLRWTRTMVFSVGFFFLTLIPTFTNFAKGDEYYIASDRYAYIPMIGLLLLVITLWSWLTEKFERRLSQLGQILAGIILAACALLSFQQTSTWKNTESLLSHTLSLYPDALAAKINLGVTYRKEQRYDDALRILDNAITQKKHSRAYTAKAAVLMEQRRTVEAIELLQEALRIDPKDPDPVYGLGLAFAATGQMTEAQSQYEQTLKLAPDHTGALNNLAAIYLDAGDDKNAEELYRNAITADPSVPDPFYNLALIMEDRREYSEAATLLEHVTDIEGDTIDVLTKLTEIYASMNDRSKTTATLKRILLLDHENSFARQMMQALGEPLP